MVYNIWNEKVIQESVVRAEMQVAGDREGECQLINAESVRELENHCFVIPKEIIDLIKDS